MRPRCSRWSATTARATPGSRSTERGLARRAVRAWMPRAICPSCQSVAGEPLAASGKSGAASRLSRLGKRAFRPIVTKREAGCGGRGGAEDERHNRVRQSRVVLTPRCWRQVVRDFSARRWWQKSRSPGRARYKPSTHCRREGRAVSGFTCMLVCSSCQRKRTRDRGCQPAPGLPCALFDERRARTTQSSDDSRRENREVRPDERHDEWSCILTAG
jgi:hypothetical protein